MVAPSIFGLLGLFLPFAFLFDRNTLDTQINTRADLEKILPTIPVAAEIPHIKNKKAFMDINDRTQIVESSDFNQQSQVPHGPDKWEQGQGGLCLFICRSGRQKSFGL